MAHTERVVVLVDMDCFYCQVEENLDPKLKGKPIAVVQYNAWRGGGIIAVNYPARDKGVTRHMRGNEAREKCPDIILARVPEVRGKADLTKYREAGKKVAEVLQTFTNLLERASVDEAYLDVTEEVRKRLQNGLDQIKIEKLANTFVVGCDTRQFIDSLKENRDFSEGNIQLAIGGMIAEEIRAEILKRTGYKCSAGVAHNKILAKLVCGLHKPNKQTLLPHNAVPDLYKDMPIKKVTSLGGKFGSALVEQLQITYMGELTKFSERELIKRFDEKTGKWLFNIARGIDLEPVTIRLISKSIGCCKNFPGKTALRSADDVDHWIKELSSEISERLEKDLEENKRRAKQMVVSFTQEANDRDSASSRTHPLQSYEPAKIARSATDVIRRFCLRADGSYCITFLGLSVGNFQDLRNSVNISSMIKNMNKKVEGSKCSDMLPNPSEEAENLTIDDEKNIPELKNRSRNSFLESWATKKNHSSNCQAVMSPEHQGNPNLGSKTTDQGNLATIECREGKNQTEPNKREAVLNKSISNSFFLNYLMTEGRHLLESNSYIVEPKKQVTPSNNFEKTCLECNQTIATSEFQSHMDYHFALNLVRTETLADEALSNVESRQEDCNKQMKLPELVSHLDIHKPSTSTNSTGNDEKSPTYPNDLIKSHSIRISEDEDMFSNDSSQKMDEAQEETSNISAYSADTEELNEDTTGLIYFEDVFSESDSSQPLFRTISNMTEENNEGETEHIDETYCPTAESEKLSRAFNDQNNGMPSCSKQNPEDTKTDISKSFFINYLENEKKKEKRTRCIDIWKTLEEAGLLLPKKVQSRPQIPPKVNDDQDCAECNKKIPASEYPTHLDYHFALKMMKEETNVKKTSATPKEEKSSKQKPNKTTSQGSKRKLTNTNKILTFLQNSESENLDENNSEVCEECNKRIKLSEIISHADYHAAKRLHTELNSPKKTTASSVRIKDKKSKTVMNLRPISNFFKA